MSKVTKFVKRAASSTVSGIKRGLSTANEKTIRRSIDASSAAAGRLKDDVIPKPPKVSTPPTIQMPDEDELGRKARRRQAKAPSSRASTVMTTNLGG